MRITFVCPVADLSGGFRVVATYARHLRQRGHDVLVVSRPPIKPTIRELLRSVYRRRPLPIGAKSGFTHLDNTGVPHKVLDRVRSVNSADLPDADVVVATWWETAEWVWALPSRKGVKVHFIQDYELWGGAKDRVDATCRLPMPKITPARWVKRLLVEEFRQTEVACVPNAVDQHTFTAPPRRKQPSPTMGFTYTPFRAKGCDIAMQAINVARSLWPEMRVVCFGSTPPTFKMPLPHGAEFHLRVPETKLKELYSRCDAWLFASRKEGFGLPILEAMACRTPVIGTPAGAAPELLCQGGGILVSPEDAADMARAIGTICGMSELQWRSMSDAAYATATRYSWDDATDIFELALVRAVEGASPGQ